MAIILVYLGVGAAAGFLAGLFGIGGGLIIVPALVYCFALQGVSAAVAVQLAVGTSLASIVFTSLSSVWAHHRHGNVDWSVWRLLAPGIAVGVTAGAVVAANLSGESLKLIIGVFALVIAVQMALDIKPKAGRVLPGRGALLGGGLVIGSLSALFGIGGGSLTVPYLTWCNVRIQQAVATSAACGLPIAVVGALSYGVTGWSRSELPEWSTGFVFWPALLAIAVCSTPAARLGANLAQHLPAKILKQSFALFLFLVGAQFIFGAL